MEEALLKELVRSAPELDEARDFLRRYRSRHVSEADAMLDKLAEVKRQSVVASDEPLAAAVWCMEQLVYAEGKYLDAFVAMGRKHFYGAWCDLERAEIRLVWLGRHLTNVPAEFSCAYLREYVPKWQALYPYTMFASPGMIVGRQRCNICNAEVRPRSSCGHRRWQLYAGEMCGRRMEDFSLNHVGLVKNPVQKHSVLFIGQSYNYGLADYVVRASNSPWSQWSYGIEQRVRTPDEFLTPEYRRLGRNDPCPCRSGKKFKKCHVLKMQQPVEHYQFSFGVRPPPDLPSYVPSINVAALDEPSSRSPSDSSDDTDPVRTGGLLRVM